MLLLAQQMVDWGALFVVGLFVIAFVGISAWALRDS